MNLTISTELCKVFEGFRAKPYLCPAGIATIGYGATYYSNGNRVTLQDLPISEPNASELLKHELQHTYLPSVLRLCPILANNERRLNAILSFVYNLGAGQLQTSTLRRKINEQDWPAAQTELKRWVRGGGKILPGLVKRRAAEAALLG